MIKVDPRTGKIVKGGSFRPRRHSDLSFVRPRSAQLLSFIDRETLIMLAQEVGRVIAEEIKKTQQAPVIIKQSIDQDSTCYEKDIPIVKIDESLVDVGIGEVEAFIRGADSARIAKAEVRTDKKLGKSKSRLRALKKRDS